MRLRNKNRQTPETMFSKKIHILSYPLTIQSLSDAGKSLRYFSLKDMLNWGGFHRLQFSLAPDFPSSNLLVRNPAGEPARSLYLTNDLVRAVLSANDYKRIRIMTAGTKIFTRQESGFGRGAGGGNDGAEEGDENIPRFRLLSDGLPAVLPYINPETIFDTGIPALRPLLETYYPLLSVFDEAFRRDVGSRRA